MRDGARGGYVSRPAVDRAVWFLRGVRGYAPKSPVARTVALGVALAIFATGIILSWDHLDGVNLARWPLILNAVLVPLGVAASSWQVRLIGRAAGITISWWRAFRVSTLGTLSSILPVSSGTVVRGGALLYLGASAAQTGRALVVDYLLWLVGALLTAGVGALLLGDQLIGWGFLAVCAACLVGAFRFGRGEVGTGLRLQLLAARLAATFVGIPRVITAFAACGFTANAAQAAVLTAPGVLGSAFFFLPGGLGVAESLTAALGAAVGLSAAAAFLAAAINRVVGLTMILVWEGAYWAGSSLRRLASESTN